MALRQNSAPHGTVVQVCRNWTRLLTFIRHQITNTRRHEFKSCRFFTGNQRREFLVNAGILFASIWPECNLCLGRHLLYWTSLTLKVISSKMHWKTSVPADFLADVTTNRSDMLPHRQPSTRVSRSPLRVNAHHSLVSLTLTHKLETSLKKRDYISKGSNFMSSFPHGSYLCRRTRTNRVFYESTWSVPPAESIKHPLTVKNLPTTGELCCR